MAIASLVIGLVLIIGGLQGRFLNMPIGIPMAYWVGAGSIYSLPISVVGLVLGVLSVRKKSKRGIAITGIALNALVMLYFLAIGIMWGILGD